MRKVTLKKVTVHKKILRTGAEMPGDTAGKQRGSEKVQNNLI